MDYFTVFNNINGNNMDELPDLLVEKSTEHIENNGITWQSIAWVGGMFLILLKCTILALNSASCVNIVIKMQTL